VFYQDNRHTFFIEADVNERTIEEWQEWVTQTQVTEPGWKIPDWWKDLTIQPEIPKWRKPIEEDPWRSQIHPGSLINPTADRDWLVNPGSAIKYGDILIGPKGQPGIEIRANSDSASNLGRLNVAHGGDMASGSGIVLTDTKSFAHSGLMEIDGRLNVVGSSGFNSTMKKNINNLNRIDFGAASAGVGRINQ
jgi:hypothetical protein